MLEDGIDLLGVVTYAGYLDPIAQSGHVMRGYKNPAIPRGSHWQTVRLMAALGLLCHRDCPGKLLGQPPTAWATVPSLPATPQPQTHPLNEMVRQLARQGGHEVVLEAKGHVQNPRAINASHFTVRADSARGRHILLIDDTWTGGGHATSAAMGLKAAGATHVSVLVLARWLSIGWEATTTAWAKRALTAPDFRPDVCPWTQGSCP
ncbi:hypothetical protein [Nostocoides vanveenii]|uniref:Phosphoribosyltransferase n=1 Tax=Nostocoides vanveenii TaxID=330835 RepID=A0ABN2KY67_9MICO